MATDELHDSREAENNSTDGQDEEGVLLEEEGVTELKDEPKPRSK